jgi:hypothetical protein
MWENFSSSIARRRRRIGGGGNPAASFLVVKVQLGYPREVDLAINATSLGFRRQILAGGR